MPKWLEISLYTFSFYCVLFVSWMLLVLPLEGETDLSRLGSAAYIPHAGRVLPVLFFGAPAIPAMIIAEFICWQYLWDDTIWERPELGIIISSSSMGTISSNGSPGCTTPPVVLTRSRLTIPSTGAITVLLSSLSSSIGRVSSDFIKPASASEIR